MFYGITNEGYVFDTNDIEYQVEEFEQGKVQTLFITGHSGSGKSTLGYKYEKELGDICYELDVIAWNYNLNDWQLMAYLPDLYEWFKGPGKKYRLDSSATFGDIDLIQASTDFIRYILSKNIRCIVEGITIFQALDEGILKIEEFKNSAMIIKGTSVTKSTVRALKRDYAHIKKEDPNIKLNAIPFNYFVNRVKYALHNEDLLREMRKKYKK